MYVRMNDVSMCMLCGSNFSTLRRKQHCRACGNVSDNCPCLFVLDSDIFVHVYLADNLIPSHYFPTKKKKCNPCKKNNTLLNLSIIEV